MTDHTYISLGGGLKLVAESYFMGALGPSMTRRSFRAWCEAMDVRMVEIGETRYVNPYSFELAVAGLLSAGSPFTTVFAPGCASIRNGNASATRLDEEGRSLIDWKAVTKDLIAWRTMNGASTAVETRSALQAARRAMETQTISHRPSSPWSGAPAPSVHHEPEHSDA